jgi:methionyl-tRNA formyltransferase
MGSPEFALPTLRAVMARHEIVCAVCQPDKPAGRGMQLTRPPVAEAAAAAGIPVLQPKSARTGELQTALADLKPDVAVVVAYGKILPQAVLDTPRLGCLNVHGSLLPRYRGAAPIQWAVIRGETETGITIMQLDAGMDTGPMLAKKAEPIRDDDTAGTLAARLAEVGATLMIEALDRLTQLTPEKQDDALATMAPMLEKETGKIDWSQPARAVSCLVRGVDPWPGAYATLGAEILKIWGARVVAGKGAPGEVLGVDRDGLTVACGEGAVALAELQLPGKKRLGAQVFASGRKVPAGTILT